MLSSLDLMRFSTALPGRRAHRVAGTVFSATLALAALLLAALPRAGHAQTDGAARSAEAAHMVVDADAAQDTISRHLYGHFAEHLGRDIYGGFWVQRGEGSSGEGAGTATDPPEGPPGGWKYNEDVIEALRAIDIPNVRWPGGCFADYYHWKDGIGARAGRPTTINTLWGGVVEDNTFGTHEFMGLVERLGAEPFVVGNVGSGTVEEMADWTEYLTAEEGQMAELRAANGHPEPWDIKYWGVGNENWICGGNMTGSYYADLYKRFATYTRHYGDGELVKVATGPSGNRYGGHEEWTRTVLDKAAPMIDALSMHYYVFVGDPWTEDRPATEFSEQEWFEAMKDTRALDSLITRYSDIMDEYDPEGRIGLYIDEWGIWHTTREGTPPGFLYQQNTLRDALVAAGALDIFNQHADRVRMANIAQTVNVLQAMILTRGDEMITTPTYHVFDLYKVHHDAALLPFSQAESPTYEAPSGEGSVAAIGGTASRDEKGRVHVTLTNTDPNRAHEVRLDMQSADVSGVARGRILTADAMNAHNTFGDPDAVAPRSFDGASVGEGTVSMRMPAKSVVMLALE
jgi:alpha-N-arabinofuranosidase